jgi:hypothetical protein
MRRFHEHATCPVVLSTRRPLLEAFTLGPSNDCRLGGMMVKAIRCDNNKKDARNVPGTAPAAVLVLLIPQIHTVFALLSTYSPVARYPSMILGDVFNARFFSIFTLASILCSSAVVVSGNSRHYAARNHRSLPNTQDMPVSERGHRGRISAGYFPNYGEYLPISPLSR